VTKKTVGDGEKLLTYLNAALKGLSALDIVPRWTKKKLNFVDQCYKNNIYSQGRQECHTYTEQDEG
jgi:hypothetical protein